MGTFYTQLFIAITTLLSLGLVFLLWRCWRSIKMRRGYEAQITYLANLVEKTSDAFISVDPDWNIISWNKGAENMYGYTREEVIGKFVPDITKSGNTKEDIKKIVTRVQEQGSLTVESLHHNKKGDALHSLSSITPLKNEKGNIYGYVLVLRDISETKKASEVLEKFNEELSSQVEEQTVLLKNIMGRLSDGFCSIDQHWNFAYINKAGADIIGLSQQELIGKNLWQLFPEAVDYPVYKAYLTAFETQQNMQVDFFYGPLNKWFMQHIYPSPSGLSIFFRDITAIKSAEEKLVESEEKYRSMIEQASDGIFILDASGKYLDINPAGLAMIGYNKEEAAHLSALDLLPEGQSLISDLRKEELQSGTAIMTERKFKRKDGTLRDTEVSFKKLSNGNFIAITRDISERKKVEEALRYNEEKYRTLIEQALDAIALYDASGKILDVNTGAAHLLGYSKDELKEMSLQEILTSEEFQESPIRYDELQSGKSTVKFRRMRRKNGTVVETEVRSQQLPDGRFLSVVRDLTERIQAEKELAASYEAIRKLTSHIQDIREEERTNIAREIHDELGQQLTVLKMDVSWLKKKIQNADGPTKEKLDDLITMLDQTVQSVRRISSELRPSLLDDLGLVAAMEWQLSEFEKRSGISARMFHSGEDIDMPDAIKTALFRIFQESLTNVARHSEAETVTVTLDKKGNELFLSITDNGRGFDKHKIEDKRTLGILGMKERIKMIGGVYEIKGDTGKGAEVIVKVPLNLHKSTAL